MGNGDPLSFFESDIYEFCTRCCVEAVVSNQVVDCEETIDQPSANAGLVYY